MHHTTRSLKHLLSAAVAVSASSPLAAQQLEPGWGPSSLSEIVASTDREVTRPGRADFAAVPVLSGPGTVSPSVPGFVVQDAYLKASNTGAGDEFGWSVALSGDTLVVGAMREDSNATGVNGDEGNDAAPDSGAAYVFIREAGSWVQQAYLKASNTEAGDFFGCDLDICGDTIVVSACTEDGGAAGVNGDQSDNSAWVAGAAYVFVRNGTTWSQEAYLKASNPGSLDNFGTAVAVSGDTIVIGAPREDSAAIGVNGGQGDAGMDTGAAYVFARANGIWSQQAYLKASNTDNGDWFGRQVEVTGDTLVATAIFESSAASGVDGDQGDDSLPGSGAAYVFGRDGNGTWSQRAYIKASNPGADDVFGDRLAMDEDTIVLATQAEDSASTGVNGDQQNDDAEHSGAVYVFGRDGGSWQQEAYIKASNTEPFDWFGHVGVSGDVLVVGASSEDSAATGVNGDQDDNSAPAAAAAYVFVRNDGTWAQTAYLKASNTDPEDIFTWVAVSGTTLAVGGSFEDSAATGVDGPQDDNLAEDSGAVYVFELTDPCNSFCTALPNATGSPAHLSCGGDPSSNLILTSAPVPNTTGQFFYGPMMLAGAPFGDGLLCVGGMTQRVLPMVTAGMMMQLPNTASMAVNYTAPYASGLIGTQHFQHWFRSGLATGSGFSTSDALSVDF